MKTYEPFTYTLFLRTNQGIAPGELIDDNGVKLKVLDIQRTALVEHSHDYESSDGTNGTIVAGFTVEVTLTVRELPEKGDQ